MPGQTKLDASNQIRAFWKTRFVSRLSASTGGPNTMDTGCHPQGVSSSMIKDRRFHWSQAQKSIASLRGHLEIGTPVPSHGRWLSCPKCNKLEVNPMFWDPTAAEIPMPRSSKVWFRSFEIIKSKSEQGRSSVRLETCLEAAPLFPGCETPTLPQKRNQKPSGTQLWQWKIHHLQMIFPSKPFISVKNFPATFEYRRVNKLSNLDFKVEFSPPAPRFQGVKPDLNW